MKKGVLLGFALFLLLGTGFTRAENVTNSVSFSEPILTPSLEFTAEYDPQKNHVIMNWSPWAEDLMWYKLVRSQENANPSYPDDGYIYYSTNSQETVYTDKSPPQGNVFYRICAITFHKEVYCSQAQKINTDNAPEDEPVFCIQVITPAVNSANGECKEFPTPCDIPNGWETVDACPVVECEEGDFFAINPETGECRDYSSSCDVPENFTLTESCEKVCEDAIAIAINPNTGECQEFPTPCDVPQDWEWHKNISSCEEMGNIKLTVVDASGAAKINWSFTGNIGTIGGFEILRSSDNQTPEYPVDTIDFIERTESLTFLDEDIKPVTQYKYMVCALNSDDQCFPASEPVLFLHEPMPEVEFSDVSAETEMGEAILHYTQKEVVSGFEDGTFQAKKEVTRAEMAKMATLATGTSPNTPEKQVFCDVPTSEWFAPFVHHFSENDFANGFEGGKCELNRFFSPHNPVLRGEAMKMIFKILDIEAPALTEEVETGFTDVKTDNWLAPYAKKAWETEVFSGLKDGTFRQNEPATRGEIMLYLRRAQELKEE